MFLGSWTVSITYEYTSYIRNVVASCLAERALDAQEKHYKCTTEPFMCFFLRVSERIPPDSHVLESRTALSTHRLRYKFWSTVFYTQSLHAFKKPSKYQRDNLDVFLCWRVRRQSRQCQPLVFGSRTAPTSSKIMTKVSSTGLDSRTICTIGEQNLFRQLSMCSLLSRVFKVDNMLTHVPGSWSAPIPRAITSQICLLFHTRDQHANYGKEITSRELPISSLFWRV
jgi:hypothetical protein